VTRISDRQLLQGIDGVGVVLVDQSTGAEITVANDDLDKLINAAAYFRDCYTERLMPRLDGPELPEPPSPGWDLGVRFGKGPWRTREGS
jgi:hypothetical protein